MKFDLNERQKEAVNTLKGPVLILAGAGSGKTKTIAERVRNLIKNGVPPYEILAITFTNKAAGEMRERIMGLLSRDPSLNRPVHMSEVPFVSTFHSLGTHILRENCQLLKIPRNFSIFDKGESKKIIREALEAEGLDPKQFEPGLIQNIISREKGMFVGVNEYSGATDSEHMRDIVAAIWRRYEEALKKEGALDFDDLLFKTAKLLKTNGAILERYQKIWKYIHIDEYQDTNETQYMIAKLLAQKERNICVVGDIDQNIYSWRGANIKNIINFEKDYPETKIILLEENYRSTKTILEAANRIIEKNQRRVPKKLFTENPTGEKISLFSAFDEADEADFVTTKTEKLAKDVSSEEIAVLFRANFQSRALEEAFLSKNIPYQLVGTRFFERKEVKDIISFLRAALNEESFSDIKRIINVPPRGIGKVTLLKILSGKEEELSGKIKDSVLDFRKILREIKNFVPTHKPSEIIKFIIKISGIESAYQSKTEENLDRLENIRELATLASKYNIMKPEVGIEKFLEDAALATDQDELAEKKSGVKLMTVHAAKGLEFDYVFIVGLEDGLFPHKRMFDDTSKDPEEERRLFYVAITRARKKLFLSYAQTRTIYGSRQVNLPSEFISDIDNALLEPENFERTYEGRKPLLNIEF